MKYLIMVFLLLIIMGVGLLIILLADLRKAKRGEKSIFWEEDDDG